MNPLSARPSLPDSEHFHHTRRGVKDEGGVALRGSTLLIALAAVGLLIAGVALLG